MIKKEDVKSKFAGEHHNCYTKGIWNWPEEHILGWIFWKSVVDNSGAQMKNLISMPTWET